MTLATALEIAAASSLAVAVGTQQWHYWDIHVPEFETVQAKQLFDDCLHNCELVCKKTCELNPPKDGKCVCDCSHCHVFIHDKDHD